MLFDSPEYKYLIEQDNLFLVNGKADWESRILELAHTIVGFKERLYPTSSEIGLEQYLVFSTDEDKGYLSERISNAREKISRLADKALVDKIESVANDIKKWEEHDIAEEEHQYPWEHVALSMLRFPDEVTFDYDTCPACGHSRIRIYFHSPKVTWATMCGVGDDMVICPNCKIQAEFIETFRN